MDRMREIWTERERKREVGCSAFLKKEDKSMIDVDNILL